MILTTTPSLADRDISAYCGIVAAEIVVTGGSVGGSIEVLDGLNFELSAQTARFGEARSQAIANIENQARKLQADAIVGVRFEYCSLGKNGLLNMVSAYGTAVRIRLSKEEQEQRRLAELRDRTNFMVSIDGKERGPFSIAQLSTLVEQGRIDSSAIVRAEDTEEDVPLAGLL